MQLRLSSDYLVKTWQADMALLMYCPGINLEGLRTSPRGFICDMLPPGFDFTKGGWGTPCSLPQANGWTIYPVLSIMDRVGGLFLEASCWSEKPPLSPSIANSLKAVTVSDSRIHRKVEKQQLTRVVPWGVGMLMFPGFLLLLCMP
jgi:hypothetical protein